MKKNSTLFLDVDGTIFKHQKDCSGAAFDPVLANEYILKDVKYCFNKWHGDGHKIILTTGRPESLREVTEAQLRGAGLFWDLLIMGIGSGERILVNDMSPKHNEPKAIGINLVRDEGFEHIDDLYHEAKIKSGMPELANGQKYKI